VASPQHHLSFTDDRLERWPAPPKTVFLYDDGQPGLVLRVTDKGAKTFLYYRRVKGKPRKIKIGRLGEVTVRQARKEAARIHGQVVEGADPRPKVETRTLGDVFSDWLEKKAKVRKRTWEQDERLYNRRLRRFRNKPFDEIDADWLKRLHRIVGKRAPVGANRLVALVSALFSFERGRGAPNPCRDVPRFPERQRDRRLKAEEFPRFAQAIDQYVAEGGSETHADCIRVLLWTGQRRGNVFAMRWRDVSLGGRAWTIPGEFFKNGQPHVAKLPEYVVGVLERRRAAAAKGAEYVFPGRDTPHLVDVRKAWRRILEIAGIDRGTIRIHDLRATFATIMAEENENIQVIAGQLGHKSIATTQRYVRLAQRAVGSAVDRTAAAMEEMAKRKEAV
jgi:integrase